MDPALIAIATASANALVTLMTTDLWERAKEGVARALRRTTEADPEALLEGSRTELGQASARGDSEETVAEMQQMWRGKFRRLLAEHPEAADDLLFLKELRKEIDNDGENGESTTISQSATSYDSSRIYQMGTGVQNNN
ncbi:hypothetical protein [Streptomyces microflavus]|uniref:hypothetical protein n=1 Tax=Streptomyces microflavus TaxID=1919 RepID=UPI0033E1C17A